MNGGIIFFLMIILISLVVSSLSDYTLDKYPSFFIEDGEINAEIIIGDNASSSDIVATSDITTMLSYNHIYIKERAKDFSIEPEAQSLPFKYGRPKSTKNILNIYSHNLISVGGPCANSVTATIMNMSTSWPDCAGDFKEGIGNLRIYNKGNKYQLIVAGYTGEDTKKSSEVLTDYLNYNLTGIAVEVLGTLGNLTVTPLVPRIEQAVIEALKIQNETKVTIVLRKGVSFDYSGKSEEEKERLSKEEQKIISNVQNEVLSTLEESDFKLKYRYPGTYALTGWITKKGLEKLKNNPDVEYIYIPAIGTET